MATQSMHNPNEFEIWSSDIEVDGVKYVCKDFSESPSTNEIDATNSDGSYRGSAYTIGKTTASCTIEKVKSSDKTPEKFSEFTLNGKKWKIKNITNSASQGALTTYSVELDEVIASA